jgi:hypothetical protein
VGLEREREGLEREREVAIQHSQQAQDRFSQELELAIAGWKRAMNAEVAKAKEVCEGLEEEKRRVSTALEQASLASSLDHTMIRHQVQRDMDCYTSKVNCPEPKVKNFLKVHHFQPQNWDVKIVGFCLLGSTLEPSKQIHFNNRSQSTHLKFKSLLSFLYFDVKFLGAD